MIRIFLLLAATPALAAVSAVAKPHAAHSLGLETGALWQVGSNTPLDYTILPNQLVWRSPAHMHFSLDGGSEIVVRARAAVMASYFAEGPESYYLGFNASPSIEWWNAAGSFSLYVGAGGGIGLVDSRGVEGGQGRDKTLNWFAHAGAEWILSPKCSLRAGAMFLHHSNGGATDPNPGIDALGATVGLHWRL